MLITRQEISAKRCSQIAREINLPVTAFINDSDDHTMFPIRYFTVTGEIPACGHATLAAAEVVTERYGITETTFLTGKKVCIPVSIKDNMVWMDYPVFSTSTNQPSGETLRSLGISTFRWTGFCPELETVFIELPDADQLKSVTPDFQALLQSDHDIKEVVITSRSDDPAYDFLLRSFCPWIGIDEDPVTGSVHSVLGPYWMAQTKKNKLVVFQASARGGEVQLEVKEDNVSLGGRVTRILRGRMNFTGME